VSYTVLARRYRSTRFSGVIGQEPIAQTLCSAIGQGRVAHAYLFTGTRGVGKTSMARIFARALNAPGTIEDAPMPPDADADGGFPPQDVQERMAEAIMRGDDLNVIEIDGASNNSVEQARQLIINAGLSPTGNARYKVYIIDEVHMLSTSAFNALLKTMEEPPPHVKFILCTTEPHKIPATIHSRCQRFDFRNIPTPKIAEHLGSVLASEKIEADEQVVWQVARLANGSMRDGLSLLDRLISTGESPLTTGVLEQMFGLPDAHRVAALVDTLAEGNVKGSLEAVAGLIDSGVSQDQVLEVLIERLRQLMLLSVCGAESELVELPEDAKAQAAQQASLFDAAGLTYMIALCESVQRNGRASATPRALLDATMVRLALAEKMADVTAVLSNTSAPAEQKKKRPADTASLKPQAPSPTPSPQPLTSQVSINTADLGAVMAALRDRVADRPAYAWLRYVNIDKLDEQAAVLSPTPGHREVLHFAKDQRRLQAITDELTPILGRRVRVSMQAPPTPDASADESASSPAHANGAVRNGDRRAAMELPLVKQVLDVFPDAVLFDVRDETDDEHRNDPPAR